MATTIFEIKNNIRDRKYDGAGVNDREAHSNFEKDVLEAVGLTNKVGADKLFRMAWSMGHADGYEEVLNIAVDLADLVWTMGPGWND